jgi:hypothetical protein
MLNGISGHAYDVGGSIPYTTLEVAKLVAEISQSTVKICNFDDVPCTTYLPHMAWSESNFTIARVSLPEAIERTLNEPQ